MGRYQRAPLCARKGSESGAGRRLARHATARGQSSHNPRTSQVSKQQRFEGRSCSTGITLRKANSPKQVEYGLCTSQKSADQSATREELPTSTAHGVQAPFWGVESWVYFGADLRTAKLVEDVK
eukprot:7952815-Pyramimonas_sp.AAC.1